MPLDALIASSSTAFGFTLLVIWWFLTERIVPKGRMDEKNKQLDEAKVALNKALDIIKEQNESVAPLLQTLINRRQR